MTSAMKRMYLKQYPIFVYGTLRNGFPNYCKFLAGKTDKEKKAIVILNIKMIRSSSKIAHDGGLVFGELMYIQTKFYCQILNSLDRMEGYKYKRKLIKVDGEKAWIYFYIHSKFQRMIRKAILKYNK